MDSKQGSNDIPFITVIDGTLGNVEEKNPTETTRTISIQLSPENQEIEIIGTYVATSGASNNLSQTTATTSSPSPSPTPANVTTTQQTPPSKTQVLPVESNQTKTQLPVSIPQENVTDTTNLFQNIIIKIPYLQNVTISLSQIDLAVIGAISLVVILVIASVARRPSRIAKKR